MASSSSFSHPFAASCKAHPGQSPSFSLEHYHSPLHIEKLSRAEEVECFRRSHAFRSISLPGASVAREPSSLQSPDQSRVAHVFSPRLAGERDRDERRRIHSTQSSAAKTDFRDFFGFAGQDDLPSDGIDEDCSAFKAIPRTLFEPFKYPDQPNPFELARSGGIFFQPPSGLDPAWTSKGRRDSISTRELELSRELSDEKFMVAISRAKSRADCSIDLEYVSSFYTTDLTNKHLDLKLLIPQADKLSLCYC